MFVEDGVLAIALIPIVFGLFMDAMLAHGPLGVGHDDVVRLSESCKGRKKGKVSLLPDDERLLPDSVSLAVQSSATN